MGFFDSFKQMISDKLDDAFGEEPVPKKAEPQDVLPEEDEIVIDPDAYADYSRVKDSAITEITGGVAIEQEEVPQEEEVETNVDVNPLLNVEKISSELNPVNMVEEQCSCKVFFRRNVPSKVVETMERSHTRVDKSNPELAVEIATRCANADTETEDKLFVGVSTQDSLVYNFIYSGSLSGSRLVEFQMYLVTLIGRCELSHVFYVPYSTLMLEDAESKDCVSLIIHTKGTRVLYNADIVPYDEHQREVGAFVDLSDNVLPEDESVEQLLYMNLKGSLYPQSHRFFIFGRDYMLHLSFLSYIDETGVQEVSQYVESIHQLMRKGEL